MTNIEFAPEEMEVLREVLRHALEEINVEVFRTDTHDFKDLLKHRREILEHVLDKLPPAPVAA